MEKSEGNIEMKKKKTKTEMLIIETKKKLKTTKYEYGK